MNELDRITVTVTRIMYGFDESELEKEGVNEYTIKGERTIVEMDGEIYYDQYAAAHLKRNARFLVLRWTASGITS